MSCKSENLEKYEVSSLEEYENDSNETEENFSNHEFVTEKQIGNGQAYILHIAATPEANCNIVVGTSDNLCEIYHLGEKQLAKLEAFESTGNPITGVQFSPDNNNLFYWGSNTDIKLWDLRSPQKSVLEFRENTKEPKQLVCFEVSPNNRLLAAGTELHHGETFMVFWDVRNVNVMGAYWESHADTITQVKFDPNDANKLMSGSVDGLINVYDVKHNSEDDALLDSYNTESSVEQLQWFTQKGKDCMSCITHTADVQLWSTDGTEPYAHFRRLDLTKAMNRKSEAHCYVVSTYKVLPDELLVLAGAHSKDKEHLKCMSATKKKLVPLGTLIGNKQRVCSSSYNPHHNVLLTGGELGLLNVWDVNFKL